MATEFLQLAERAQREGTRLLPELRQFLDRHPSFWQTVGDVAASARRAIAELATQGEIAWQEVILRETAELTKELLGERTASPLERLLAMQVATCRLAAAEADLTATQRLDRETPARAHFFDQRRDRAHRRYEASLKTFALVSKLLVPSPRPIEIASRLEGTTKTSRQVRPRAGLRNDVTETSTN